MKSEKGNETQQENKRAVEIEDLPPRVTQKRSRAASPITQALPTEGFGRQPTAGSDQKPHHINLKTTRRMNMEKENIVANVNQAGTDQAADIEDLTAAEADTEQVKGGTAAGKDPAFMTLGFQPWTTR